jgi:hypothetical protein
MLSTFHLLSLETCISCYGSALARAALVPIGLGLASLGYLSMQCFLLLLPSFPGPEAGARDISSSRLFTYLGNRLLAAFLSLSSKKIGCICINLGKATLYTFPTCLIILYRPAI